MSIENEQIKTKYSKAPYWNCMKNDEIMIFFSRWTVLNVCFVWLPGCSLPPSTLWCPDVHTSKQMVKCIFSFEDCKALVQRYHEVVEVVPVLLLQKYLYFSSVPVDAGHVQVWEKEVTQPCVMDSKKNSLLRQLRQKMLPHFRREKSSPSKSAIQLEYAEEHRLSCSVPDVRDMRKMYTQSPSGMRLQQHNASSYSNLTSPYVMPGRGQGEGGSGFRIGPVGDEAGRSEHRLGVPVDSVEWSHSQESLCGLCPEQRSPPDSNYKVSRGMEPEELALPEMMTVYSPEHPSGDGSQDSSQVWSLPQTKQPCGAATEE